MSYYIVQDKYCIQKTNFVIFATKIPFGHLFELPHQKQIPKVPMNCVLV